MIKYYAIQLDSYYVCGIHQDSTDECPDLDYAIRFYTYQQVSIVASMIQDFYPDGIVNIVEVKEETYPFKDIDKRKETR